MGQGYLSVKVYDKVLPYLETSLHFARETEDNEVILDNYQALSRLFAVRGDYKTALDYHKQYAEVMLEVSKEKSSRQLAEMQTRLETFKKEKEIELLKKSTEILEKDNRLHRITRNTFIAGFILLAAIHAQNIIHRDLKPSNIIILAERNRDMPFIKLLDFGLARTRSQTRLTQSGALMGTINYISPEQLSHSRCSPASDIYSLGVTFYEMLTGITAFQGDTATEIVVRILERMPEELLHVRTDVPEALNRLVMEMMRKDPEQRPSAEVVRRTIENFSQSKVK